MISLMTTVQSALVVVGAPVSVIVTVPSAARGVDGTTVPVMPPGMAPDIENMSPTRPLVRVMTTSAMLSSASVRTKSLSTIGKLDSCSVKVT